MVDGLFIVPINSEVFLGALADWAVFYRHPVGNQVFTTGIGVDFSAISGVTRPSKYTRAIS